MAPRQKAPGRRSPRHPVASRRRAATHATSIPRSRRAIEAAINSGEIVAVGVLHLVRQTIVSVLTGVQDVGAELGAAAVAAVRGSIKAAYSIGADLGVVAREAVRGTVTAAEQIGGDLGGVARSAAGGAVRATGDVGGDVATVARRAVEGSVAAARELGLDVRGLARSAADGAMEAADRIGGAASRAVRATLSGTVAGVRSLVREAGSANPRRAARRGTRSRTARRAESRPAAH